MKHKSRNNIRARLPSLVVIQFFIIVYISQLGAHIKNVHVTDWSVQQLDTDPSRPSGFSQQQPVTKR